MFVPVSDLPDPMEKHRRGGSKKGEPHVRNDSAKRIQALAFMRFMTTTGADAKQTAAHFGTKPSIVRARLSYAQRAGLFTQHEDVILSGMVPMAENVLVSVLHPDSLVDPELKVKVALEVYKGTGLFRKPGVQAPATAERGGKKGDTLEEHIARLRASKESEQAQLPEPAIDVEVVDHGHPSESGGEPGSGTATAGPENRAVDRPVADAAERDERAGAGTAADEAAIRGTAVDAGVAERAGHPIGGAGSPRAAGER
jgi:hypothetical protein